MAEVEVKGMGIQSVSSLLKGVRVGCKTYGDADSGTEKLKY